MINAEIRDGATDATPDSDEENAMQMLKHIANHRLANNSATALTGNQPQIPMNNNNAPMQIPPGIPMGTPPIPQTQPLMKPNAPPMDNGMIITNPMPQQNFSQLKGMLGR